MAANLPEGLIDVTITANYTVIDDSTLDRTNSEVLRRFWKGMPSQSFTLSFSCTDLILVYATQSEITHSISIRCRNLFWRIWSSPDSSQFMTSARLIPLWNRCNQDFDFTSVADHTNLSCKSTAQFNSTASGIPCSADCRCKGALKPVSITSTNKSKLSHSNHDDEGITLGDAKSRLRGGNV